MFFANRWRKSTAPAYACPGRYGELKASRLRFAAVSIAPRLLPPSCVSRRNRSTAKLVAGSYVVSARPAHDVTASMNPSANPPGSRPVSFAAPRMVVGCRGALSPYTPASCGVRPMRRL